MGLISGQGTKIPHAVRSRGGVQVGGEGGGGEGGAEVGNSMFLDTTDVCEPFIGNFIP